MSLRFAESANAAEIAEEVGNSLEVLLSTYTHVIAELRGASTVSAEALILEARRGHKIGHMERRFDRLERQTVLDPFLGSETTAVVARSLGRHAVGIELNPEYAALAKARLAS